MKFKNLLLIIALFVAIKSNAQEFKLGKVSVAELEEKSHPQDPSAVAAILFKKGDVRFEYNQDKGFEMVTKVKTRVKIYKKEGYDWANQTIQYYIGSNLKESVSFSDAVTFNLIDGKIEKTKLKSEGEFDENINKYWGKKKVTMPNVNEGSVIEYEYTVRSSRISELKEWFFQTSIPVNYSEFVTHIPEYFIYNPNSKGYIFPKVTVEKKQNTITYNYREQKDPGRSITTKSSQEKLQFLETNTTYLAENLPAMKEEAFVNIDNYTASVSHELSMTKFPNQPFKSYSTDWNAVVKTIYDYDDFGPELNKSGYFEDDLKLVLANITTPEAKIDAILKHVKATVKWNDYYGYSCNEGVKKAYKDKTGNVAEINLMLTAMLRYAGLNANPVLVSTRSNGIAMFPNRTAFNYVIAAVENGGNYTLLDASDIYSTPNVLPLQTLNWFGRLIRKDGSSVEIDLMPSIASNDTTTMFYSIDEQGVVKGKMRRQQDAHNALQFRDSFKNIKEDAYIEKLENENNKIEIQEYSRTNEKELNLPVIEAISFTGSNFSEIIGGKIYIKPLLSFASSQNPFKQDNREYPVDFGFPFIEKYAVNIVIPEGYTVEAIPESISLMMENDFGNFKCLTSVSGNSIQVMVINQVNVPIVAADYYTVLKEYYQKLTDKQNEKIVLRKI
jgi:hypothetical protein